MLLRKYSFDGWRRIVAAPPRDGGAGTLSGRYPWIVLVLIGVGCMATASRAPSGQRILDDFSQRSDAAARMRWQAMDTSPPVRTASDGGLLFDCPFARLPDDRFYWDRVVDLDLSAQTALTLDLAVSHPEAFRSLAIYLESGDGWYVWSRPLTRAGRQRLTLLRDDFSTEGTPAGWNRIQRIRLSPWRGSQRVDARLQLVSLRAMSPAVLLVRATGSVPDAGERAVARRVTRYLARRSTALGITHAVIDEDDLTPAMLETARVVVLGYHPTIPDPLYRMIESFLDRQGKLMVFYSADQRLAKRMGFELGEYQVAAVPLQWSAFVFDDPGRWEVPSRVMQHSWNIRSVRPAREDAEIIAWWENAQGERSGDPAWGISRNGTWMTHVLLEGDNLAKENLLVGLLTRWLPDLWPDILAATLDQAGCVGSYTSLEQAVDAIGRDVGALAPDSRRVGADKLSLATQCYRRAQQASRDRRYAEAYRLARACRRLLTEAMAMTLTPRPDEFRGVWDHHAVGWYPGDWQRSAEELRKAGMTAIFPNVAWGGLAHYASTGLPRSSTYERFGDQLTAAMRAARDNALELHAWIVCWNLGGTPAAFREQMRRENRLQRDAQGNELAWLCPAHPDNRRHMLGVVREIAEQRPDGIHLDYIRFPGAHACFCDTCRRQVERRLGQAVTAWPQDARDAGPAADAWSAHRVATINTFVEQVYKTVNVIDPEIVVSAAVFGGYPASVRSIGQDWGAWLRAGWLDMVAPMNYTDDTATFVRWIREQQRGPAAGQRLIPGIGVASSEAPLTADQVLDQLLAARRLGVPGILFFALDLEFREHVLPLLQW